MQAYVIEGHGDGQRRQVALPVPRPGEALIKVTRVGICNTDLEILKGYQGFQGILGHEFIGEVTQIEDTSVIKVGQRVVGDINAVCDDCVTCSKGGVTRRNHCPKRTVMGIIAKDGVFAEYITLPVRNLHVVPSNVPDEVAVFVEPLAAAFRIIEQQLVKPDDDVAVIGDGKLGLLINRVLRSHTTGRVVAFGKHKDKLDLLGSNIETVISTNARSLYENSFDVCVEASGSPSGLMIASAITRPLGTIVLKTTCVANDPDFSTVPLVVKEISVVGSRCGNFPMALKALEQGAVQVRDMIAGVYPLSEIDKAIEHARKKGTLKIQLTIH